MSQSDVEQQALAKDLVTAVLAAVTTHLLQLKSPSPPFDNI